MVNCVVFVLTIVIGTCACVPPSVTKHYREYEYNKHTDAFYKLHVEARRRRDVKSEHSCSTSKAPSCDGDVCRDTLFPQIWLRRVMAGTCVILVIGCCLRVAGLLSVYAQPLAVCEVEGASLMEPLTQEDIVQVHGMFKRYPDLGQYLWVASDGQDHEPAPEPAIIDLSEVDQSAPSTSCDVLTRDGEIEELPCFRELPFVCKVEAKDAPYDSQCNVFARDYHYNATVGSCYSIRRWVSTWDEAYSECSNEGAHLVVLNSELEKEAVRQLMTTTPRVMGAKNEWYYYAGFRAIKAEGEETRVFKTIFNRTLPDAGYAEWTFPEPNNVGGDEYCGSLFIPDGNLNDVACHNLYAFICEKEVAART